MKLIPLCTVALTVAVIGATFDAPAAHAATPASSAAEARYQKDRADCLAGKTGEDQKTCLKEAGASLQAAKARDLKSPTGDAEAANARKRCDAFTGADKETCLARVEDGTKSGSVKGGGELREYREVVPGTPPAPAQAPAPQGQ